MGNVACSQDAHYGKRNIVAFRGREFLPVPQRVLPGEPWPWVDFSCVPSCDVFTRPLSRFQNIHFQFKKIFHKSFQLEASLGFMSKTTRPFRIPSPSQQAYCRSQQAFIVFRASLPSQNISSWQGSNAIQGVEVQSGVTVPW
jgi:hypothetical protein